MPAEPLPRSVAEADDPAYWFLNTLNIVKATTESTRGAYSMICSISPPGHETPYHLHHEEDEAFYVLDGEFTFFSEGKKTILCSGGYIFLPRGIPHGIRCTGSAPSSMLILGDARRRLCGNDVRDGGACEGARDAAAYGTGY